MKLIRGLLCAASALALIVAPVAAEAQTLQGGWLGPAGSPNQLQFNSAGQLGGASGDCGVVSGAIVCPTVGGGLTPATIPSAPTTGDCVKWLSATTLGDSGAACGGGGGGASLTAANTWTPNGAASAAAEIFTGTVFTGGTGTTTFPYFYFDQGATQPTTFSVNGTLLGYNAASGCTGNFLDLHVNGGASLFSVACANGGIMTNGNLTSAANVLAGAVGSVGPNGRGLFSSSGVGHVNWNGSAPAVSACGSSTIDSNAHDTAGTVTFAGSPTSCTITFAVAYTTFAHCTVSFPTAISGVSYSYTKTAITVAAAALTGSADYRCDGT